MSTDLAPLIARVEAATGPNIRLETEIAIALRYGEESYPGYPLGSFKDGYMQADMGRDGWSVGWKVPPFTASLDAALALVGRVLPGWNASAILLRDDPCEGHVWEPGHVGSIQGKAATPALALILALLRALQAQA